MSLNGVLGIQTRSRKMESTDGRICCAMAPPQKKFNIPLSNVYLKFTIITSPGWMSRTARTKRPHFGSTSM